MREKDGEKVSSKKFTGRIEREREMVIALENERVCVCLWERERTIVHLREWQGEPGSWVNLC